MKHIKKLAMGDATQTQVATTHSSTTPKAKASQASAERVLLNSLKTYACSPRTQ